MRTLREILSMLDVGVNSILNHRLLTKEEFLAKFPDSEKLYNLLSKSKVGLIKISYLNGTNEHSGFTAAFGKDIACRLSNEDEWYSTSIIKSIDWDNKTFETLHNIYKFEFQELPIDKVLFSAKELYNKVINESKNKEVK